MQCRSSSTQASGAGITSACAALRRIAAAAHRHVAIAENKVIHPTRGMWSTWVCRGLRDPGIGVGRDLSVGVGEEEEARTLGLGRDRWMYRQNCHPRLTECLPWYSGSTGLSAPTEYLNSSMQFKCIECCQDEFCLF